MINLKKTKNKSYTPLFDRLIDDHIYVIDDTHDFSLLDNNGLYESIMRELNIILNTRTTAKSPAEEDDFQGGSDYDLPIYFGLNDFSWFDSSQEFYLYQIASKIETVIKRFEPRLKEPMAKIEKINRGELGMNVTISGYIKSGDATSKMSFPITIKRLFSQK
jgi:type VI secretion system lysozyme-like protein